jgi:hypothetical protein
LYENLCVFYIFRHVFFPKYSRGVIPLHQTVHTNSPTPLESTSFFFLTFGSLTVSSYFPASFHFLPQSFTCTKLLARAVRVFMVHHIHERFTKRLCSVNELG